MTAVLIPRETVTADNYGPAVSVITWILIVSAVLGVLLKVGLGVSARVAIGSDDATLIVATVKYLTGTKRIFSNAKANMISDPEYRAINSGLDSDLQRYRST